MLGSISYNKFSIFFTFSFIPIQSFSFSEQKPFWKDCVRIIRRNPLLSQACVTLKIDMKGYPSPGAIHLLEHLILTGKDDFELEKKGLYLQAYSEPSHLVIKIYSKEDTVPEALNFLNRLGNPAIFSRIQPKDLDQQKKIILLEDKTLKIWKSFKQRHQQLNQVNNITLEQLKAIHRKYWNSQYFYLTIDYPGQVQKKIPFLKSPWLFGLGEGKGSSLYRIFRLGLGVCYSCGTKDDKIFIYSDKPFTEVYFKDVLLKDIARWNESHLERIRKLGPLEVKGIGKMVGHMPDWNLNQLKSSAIRWVSKAQLEVTREIEGLFCISLKSRIEDKGPI